MGHQYTRPARVVRYVPIMVKPRLQRHVMDSTARGVCGLQLGVPLRHGAK